MAGACYGAGEATTQASYMRLEEEGATNEAGRGVWVQRYVVDFYGTPIILPGIEVSTKEAGT